MALTTQTHAFAFFSALGKDEATATKQLMKMTTVDDYSDYLIRLKAKSEDKVSVCSKYGISGTSGNDCMRKAADKIHGIFAKSKSALYPASSANSSTTTTTTTITTSTGGKKKATVESTAESKPKASKAPKASKGSADMEALKKEVESLTKKLAKLAK